MPAFSTTTTVMTALSPDQHETRPRAMSTLSHESKRSRRSSNSTPKLDLTETHQEKKRLHTKADPTQALNEAQPSVVALQESNLGDLHADQHKDYQGNIITDPDRSNPTRPRLERPLDTIRSFQMAAESTYSTRRATYSGRPGTTPTNGSPARPANQDTVSQADFGGNGGNSRRNSYYGANNGTPQYRSRPGTGGYYHGRGFGGRPDSFAEYPHGPPQQYQKRNASAPMSYGPNGEYNSPSHSHQMSYDGVTSGSDQNNNSTNPSSLNSSVDQIHQQRKVDDYSHENQYGQSNGYSPVSPTYSRDELSLGPSYNGNGSPEAMRYANGPYSGAAQNGNQFRAPVPPPKPNNPRVPIKLNTGSSAEEAPDYFPKKSGSKRQSWFKRRFSKG